MLDWKPFILISNQSINQHYSRYYYFVASPLSLRFRGCAQPCSGSGEGWLRSHTDTKSISVSARRKLPLSLTGSWSFPSVVIGVSSQHSITFCRDPHKLSVSKKLLKNINMLLSNDQAHFNLLFDYSCSRPSVTIDLNNKRLPGEIKNKFPMQQYVACSVMHFKLNIWWISEIWR